MKVNYILIEFMSSEVSLKKVKTVVADVTVFLLNCETSFCKFYIWFTLCLQKLKTWGDMVVVTLFGLNFQPGVTRLHIQGHKWAVIFDFPCVYKNLLLLFFQIIEIISIWKYTNMLFILYNLKYTDQNNWLHCQYL
jgi:hypothetical protein